MGASKPDGSTSECEYHGEFKADEGCAKCINETETDAVMVDLGIRVHSPAIGQKMVDDLIKATANWMRSDYTDQCGKAQAEINKAAAPIKALTEDRQKMRAALESAPVHRLGEALSTFIERYKIWHREDRRLALGENVPEGVA